MHVCCTAEDAMVTLGEFLQDSREELTGRPFQRICMPLRVDDPGIPGALAEPLCERVPETLVVRNGNATRHQVEAAIDRVATSSGWELWTLIDENCSLWPLQRLIEDAIAEYESRTSPPALDKGIDLAA